MRVVVCLFWVVPRVEFQESFKTLVQVIVILIFFSYNGNLVLFVILSDVWLEGIQIARNELG